MSHDYHQGQENYSSSQLLHDGCEECRQRSKNLDVAIGHLDSFHVAWQRAFDFGKGRLDDVCRTEAPLLRVLWAIQVQLERDGLQLGEYPGFVFAEGFLVGTPVTNLELPEDDSE